MAPAESFASTFHRNITPAPAFAVGDCAGYTLSPATRSGATPSSFITIDCSAPCISRYFSSTGLVALSGFKLGTTFALTTIGALVAVPVGRGAESVAWVMSGPKEVTGALFAAPGVAVAR